MPCRFSGGKHKHMIKMQKNVHDTARWLSPQGVARNDNGCQLLDDNHQGWGGWRTIWCGIGHEQFGVVCKQLLRQSKPSGHHPCRPISLEATSFTSDFGPGGKECNDESKESVRYHDAGTAWFCSRGQVLLCSPDIDPGWGTSVTPEDKGDEDNGSITVTTKNRHSFSVMGSVGRLVTNTLLWSQEQGRCCGRSLHFG